MGCSRKVAVAGARVQDIVVCRHSTSVVGVCGLADGGRSSLDDRPEMRSARARSGDSARKRLAARRTRSRRRVNWRDGGRRDSRDNAARGRLVLCGGAERA
jgi:hypothetical protein